MSNEARTCSFGSRPCGEKAMVSWAGRWYCEYHFSRSGLTFDGTLERLCTCDKTDPRGHSDLCRAINCTDFYPHDGDPCPTCEPAVEKKPMGLWRYNGIEGGKYLVTRRDGTIPEWPSFVIGARDPSAPAALRAYADDAEKCGMNADYVRDVRRMADEFTEYAKHYGHGDPGVGPHRKDDPAVIEKMKRGKSA